MRSYEDSLQRLGINRISALIIHDLDLVNLGSEEAVAHHFDQLENGGFARSKHSKATGAIAAIGAGVNRRGTIPRFLERFDLDFFLVATPYSLVEQDVLDESFRSARPAASASSSARCSRPASLQPAQSPGHATTTTLRRRANSSE